MTVAFVLGNGRSRLGLDLNQLASKAQIYGCNALYREFQPHVLVATDRPISEAIQCSGYSAQHQFYTRKPIPGLGALEVPQKYFGFSSGPIAVALAALSGHSTVYLLGFDMGALPGDRFNNVYADTEFYKKSSSKPTYTGNWIRQLVHIARDFPGCRFVRVTGEESAIISQLEKIDNFTDMDLSRFQDWLNNSKES